MVHPCGLEAPDDTIRCCVGVPNHLGDGRHVMPCVDKLADSFPSGVLHCSQGTFFVYMKVS